MSFWKGVVTGLSVAALLASILRVAIAQDNLKDKPTRAGGCPLDAIEYDPPAFTKANPATFDKSLCYKVVDRQSGMEWWLLRMSGKWVVLPITDGEEGEDA